jgi:hypothetical protein
MRAGYTALGVGMLFLGLIGGLLLALRPIG